MLKTGFLLGLFVFAATTGAAFGDDIGAATIANEEEPFGIAHPPFPNLKCQQFDEDPNWTVVCGFGAKQLFFTLTGPCCRQAYIEGLKVQFVASKSDRTAPVQVTIAGSGKAQTYSLDGVEFRFTKLNHVGEEVALDYKSNEYPSFQCSNDPDPHKFFAHGTISQATLTSLARLQLAARSRTRSC